MSWLTKFNAWKNKQDWKSHKDRESIDEAIVNKLSSMMDKMETQLQEANDALQFCSGTSYATDANEMANEYLNKWKAWN